MVVWMVLHLRSISHSQSLAARSVSFIPTPLPAHSVTCPQAPPKEYFHDLLSQYSHLTCLFQHCEQYAAKARQLRQEYQALGQCHLQLTGQAPAAFF